MGFVMTLHDGLANTTWLFFLALGLWGCYRGLQGQELDGSYLGGLAIGEGLFVVQAILGGILWVNIGADMMARPWMHLLYGTFALVFMPFVYFVMLRGDDSNRGQWTMAFVSFFLFGIALRSIGIAAEMPF